MTIGVFFGSRSPEHDISIITGQLIIAGLKKLNHQVLPVYLGKQGDWFIGDDLGTIKSFTSKTDFPKFAEYFLALEKSQGKLVFRKKGLVGKEISVDMAFPAFHGTIGEDGAFQGMMEMFNVPYVGCGVSSSAISMDKVLTKQFYRAQGIPTAEFVNFTLRDWQADKTEVIKKVAGKLKWPFFVKPPLLGSSIGITKVKDIKELELAIEVALHYGNTVLVEEGVENLMDITCCVIGNENPIPSLLQESAYSKDMFSYDDKYINDGGAQTGKSTKNVIIPARLDEKITAEIQVLSVKIFQLLGCAGIARFDFLFDTKAKKYFANEVNPMPGTLYHHLWAKSGVEFPDLLERLIKFAKSAHEKKNRYQTTFESDILKMAGSTKLKIKKDDE